MPKRVIVVGAIQGYCLEEGDKSHFEDMRDAFSVEDNSLVIFDEPIEKVIAARQEGDLMSFVRDHRKQTFVNCADVYREVIDALDQDKDEAGDDDVPADDPWRLECIRAIKGYCCAALADKYINEAEHQDGYGYWKQFSSIAEVIEDVNRYVENLEE